VRGGVKSLLLLCVIFWIPDIRANKNLTQDWLSRVRLF
jgi:hypothetical protein